MVRHLLIIVCALLAVMFMALPAYAQAAESESFPIDSIFHSLQSLQSSSNTSVYTGCEFISSNTNMREILSFHGHKNVHGNETNNFVNTFTEKMIDVAGNYASLKSLCASLTKQSGDVGIADEIQNTGANILLAQGLEYAHQSGLPYLTRLEIEGSISGKTLKGDAAFSVTSIQPLWEERKSGHFLFNQVSWYRQVNGTDDGDPDNTVNAGIVYRRLLNDDNLLLGLNAFFDHQLDQNHNRFSIGAEAHTSLYGVTVNRYIPLTQWKGIDKYFEARALAGWDLELSGRLPEYSNWTAFVRGYSWNGYDGAGDIYGVDTNVEWNPVPALVFKAGVIDDNDRAPEMQAALRFKINFNEPLALQFQEREGLQSVADKVYDKVRRENIIRTQVRRRLSTALNVIESVGGNTVQTSEGALMLYAGLNFGMPATVSTANTVGAVARIQFSNGAVLSVGRNTRVSIDTEAITLISGTMQYVSGSTNIAVVVPGAQITLMGTDIDVVSDGTTSTVRVRDGSIRVDGNTSGSVNLAAGQMGQVINGIVSGVALGSAPYETHGDTVNSLIDKAAQPQDILKASSYIHASPRIISSGQNIGEAISIGVSFTKPVIISGGTPRVTFTINGLSRTANLASGSGTSDLVFNYTIQAADSNASNITVTGIDLNGSTITGNDGLPAVTSVSDISLSLENTIVFLPSSLPDLALWLDADDPTTITSSGGAVSQWDDKSGNIRHASQGAPANRPVTGTRTINGKNVLDFVGVSGHHLSIPVAGIANISNGPNTTFIVFSADDNSNEQRLISAEQGGGGFYVNLDYDATSQVRFHNGGTLGLTVTKDNSGHIIAMKRNSTNMDLWMEGSALTASNTNGSDRVLTVNMRIGRSTLGGSNLDGTIGEIIIYDTALTSTEINQVSAYLATKWGLSWSDIP